MQCANRVIISLYNVCQTRSSPLCLAAEEDLNHPAHLKEATQPPAATFKASGCPEQGQQVQSETSVRLVPKQCATGLATAMALDPQPLYCFYFAVTAQWQAAWHPGKNWEH